MTTKPPPDNEKPETPDRERTWDAGAVALELPATDERLAELRAGDLVLVSGKLLLLTPEARLSEPGGEDGEEPGLPEVDIGALFLARVSTAPMGKVIGAIGQAPASLYDSEELLARTSNLSVIIGGGPLPELALERFRPKHGIQLTTVGGAGALLSSCVRQSEVVSHEQIRVDALRLLTVADFPALVAVDAFGRSLFDRRSVSDGADSVSSADDLPIAGDDGGLARGAPVPEDDGSGELDGAVDSAEVRIPSSKR